MNLRQTADTGGGSASTFGARNGSLLSAAVFRTPETFIGNIGEDLEHIQNETYVNSSEDPNREIGLTGGVEDVPDGIDGTLVSNFYAVGSSERCLTMLSAIIPLFFSGIVVFFVVERK